jgi:tyrosinase
MARRASVAASKVTKRYDQVKTILDTAAGSSKSDYGGAGCFWDDLDKLKKAKVYGVSMIAPEEKTSCCDDGSRSARSGLIRGLRGMAPFDGNRFPPLMWGGTRVAEPDIAFIADWIDDGCPADDHLSTFDIGKLDAEGGKTTRIKLAEVAEFEAFGTGAKRHAYREGEPRQRQNLDCMSPPEVERLRHAFRAIYDIDYKAEDRRNYNNQALIHQNHCQHGWERFLPWHRAYLYEFEQNLQDFEPGIMLPYWDWTMPQYKPDNPTKGYIIPQAFQAFLTEEEADKLVSELDPKPTKQQADGFRALAKEQTLFVSQHCFFCYVITTIGYTDVTPLQDNPNRQRMIRALLNSNALWYPLRYPAQYAGGGTINSVIHYHYPTAADMAQILGLNNFRDFGGGSVYDAAFGFLDQNPHNTMHIWTGGMNPDAGAKTYACARNGSVASASPALMAAGEAVGDRRNATARIAGRKFHRFEDLCAQPDYGDMFSNLTASYDPVFWPIHVNVDRTWWDWQTQHPTGLPADLDAVLSPWSYTVRDMLEISRFGYEYVRSSFFMPVGMEAPIARFVSKPITVDKKVKSFRKAEVRLHWVPQLLRSCFVRAFINQPGADASTPITDNPHYAGYLAIFGHGECYGGPGHCDLPPPRARAFDQRPRSHNTPRNHRIDVTEAARKALAKSDEVRITLVVIGVDYREERDLLKLEGVSLNFLD